MAEISDFIARWTKSSAAERSNFQPFMVELCDVLGLPRPDPATENEADNDYVFERVVQFRHDDGSQSTGRIDLYKRGCFVLEGKQSKKRQSDPRAKEMVQLGLKLGEASFTRTGSGKREGRGWDMVMAAAKTQAEGYAKALPKEDGWPPFIIVVDVGHVIEVYADFSLQGKHYAQFPDRQGYRIALEDLAKPEIQERLKKIWLEPLSLDPAKVTAAVTQDIAQYLALLSKSLEKRGHNAASTAAFLMRCLFTMFAEDVGLLSGKAFQTLLERHKGKADQLQHALPHLWKEMNDGGYSPTLGEKILKFNGGLFKDATALAIDEQELGWLLLAAKREWTAVEPAIFGTLLERALDPKERHKLGAHYTPRAYVERLVTPTILEPLKDEWRDVKLAAAAFLNAGEKDKALGAVKSFHEKLCATRVLDPACGTGNFLYVAMELMKTLEGEVLDLLADLGDAQYMLELDRHTVDPHQFLGLEINPRAVAIAELVLWIGYLQWHFRTRGKVMPAEPVLKAFANIKEQDAVLAFDKKELLRGKDGKPLTRWDGVTKKISPVTGEEIPDPEAQVELYSYSNPRPATWPEADFIIGNPPFIGNKRMIAVLGEGYSSALRSAYSSVPATVDYVMYWWHKAAMLVGSDMASRFGLITTNSITQVFNRSEIEKSLSRNQAISLSFAVPDHPWVDTATGAAVRIAMTVLAKSREPGVLMTLRSEKNTVDGSVEVEFSEQYGTISSSLETGLDIAQSKALRANDCLCYQGCKLVGSGFQISRALRDKFLKRYPGLDKRLPRYFAGNDLTRRWNERYVIDFFGLSEEEAKNFGEAYQRLYDEVRPSRMQVRRQGHKDHWWIFGETRPGMRRALHSISRYIATSEVAKHRVFTYLQWPQDLVDGSIIAVAHSDAYILGVMSSRPHLAWTLAAGGTLEDRPRYSITVCFDPFPFPAATEAQKEKIRKLGERLDAFRKERLASHDFLTMTKLYNVLEKLRAGEAFDETDKAIHEAGLVSVLKQIHDELDAAVAEAYGWPASLSDEEILEKLVALNKERAAEERKGLVRWLRPEFQAPKEAAAKPKQMEAELVAAAEAKTKPAFPKTPSERVTAVRALLAAEGKPIKAGELARRFKQGGKVEPQVAELLQIMAALGQAQTENGSRYFAAR